MGRFATIYTTAQLELFHASETFLQKACFLPVGFQDRTKKSPQPLGETGEETRGWEGLLVT